LVKIVCILSQVVLRQARKGLATRIELSVFYLTDHRRNH